MRPSPPPKPAKPREHQREAIRDVVKGFTKADRGQLIMACGTGKTLTSLFIKEKLAAERTLVLVPSLSLLKQTMQVWRVNAKVPFEALPVCSDETVGRSEEDAAVAHTSELGVPVTTDPHDIAAFLRRRSGPRVVFSTYQSSPQIAAAFAVGRVPAFDLVIADEAHRVAGIESSDFATVLDETAIKARRRLFMTATPRYFTGRVLKAAQEADLEVASMDDPAKFGTVFHRLSFGEAIKRSLLTDYQVAVVGVDNDTYREWAEKGTLVTRDGKKITDARTLAGQIGLAKAMRNPHCTGTSSRQVRRGSSLQQANARCEAVICLLSKHWEASRECQTEFRYAENPGKTILCARLEPVPDTNITSEWQRCDLFPGHGLTTAIDIADGGVRWCWTPWGCSGGWMLCGPWGLGRAFPVAAAGRPGPGPVSGVGTAGRC